MPQRLLGMPQPGVARAGYALAIVVMGTCVAVGFAPTADAQQSCNGDWPKFRRTLDNTGYNDCETTIGTANVADLELAWPARPRGDGSPVVAGGTVYIQAADGISAYDAQTGGERWTTPGVGGSAMIQYEHGVVYFSNGEGAWALDAETGTVRWNNPDPGGIDSGVAVVDGVLYSTSESNAVFALDAATGVEIWRTTLSTLSGSITAVPAVVGGAIYFATNGPPGEVYKLDIDDGSVLATAIAGGLNVTSLAVANGLVYAGTVTGQLLAFSADDLSLSWASALPGGAIGSSVAVAYDTVYVGSLDGLLAALDAVTGTPKWITTGNGPILSSPAIANGVLYVGAGDGSVHAFDAQAGGLPLWSYAVGGVVSSSPAIANGMLFIGGDETDLGNEMAAFRIPGAAAEPEPPANGGGSGGGGALAWLDLLAMLAVFAASSRRLQIELRRDS